MNVKHFRYQDIEIMDPRFRSAFINSIGGFKSIALIGTIDEGGVTNLAIFNSVFHIGANPPLCGIIVRPDTVVRHTLENIMQTDAYTINHIHKNIYKRAHQTAAKYSKSVSEFDVTALTTEYSDMIRAPYVKESRIRFGLHLEERIDLKVNGTILLIGKIVETFVPEDCIMPDGYIDIEKAGSLTCSGLDSYHTTNRLARLSYAKPDTPPLEI